MELEKRSRRMLIHGEFDGDAKPRDILDASSSAMIGQSRDAKPIRSFT